MTGSKPIKIYTDGACLGNPGPGGYAAVLLLGRGRKEVSAGRRQTTNNRMELLAAILGLSTLKQPSKVELYSDSKYLVDNILQGNVRRWWGNGWKLDRKTTAQNIDLWEIILDLCRIHNVTFIWVEGHSGNPENERCDQLAMQTARRANLPADEPYENGKTKLSTHSLFAKEE